MPSNERNPKQDSAAWVLVPLAILLLLFMLNSCAGDNPHAYNADPQNVGYSDNYCWDQEGGCP